MNSTKSKILKSALKLFNSDGLSKTTLRTIAKEINISQGNLNYHFKKRDQIIEALYFNLVEEINYSIEKSLKFYNQLELIFSISKSMMNLFFEYRFIFLDFSQLMRQNKTIKQHYTLLSSQRKEQFKLIFDVLIDENVLRSEQLPDEYNNLYSRIQILGDFWMSSAQTTHKKINKSMIKEYGNIINQAIYPYLTKKGRAQYAVIIE